jgi:hypothetical protein
MSGRAEETPRLLGGYNVRSVRIRGIVKELAASDVEEIPKLVTEDLVRVDQVAVGIVLVDEFGFWPWRQCSRTADRAGTRKRSHQDLDRSLTGAWEPLSYITDGASRLD